jgi:hypothetical protein
MVLKTTAVARQLLNSDHIGIRTDANETGMVFSTRSTPRCYKQDSWGNESVVRQLPAGKNMSTEAEDIVGIHRL